MKYLADFYANSGSAYNSNSYEFTSFSEAKKEIKRITKANHFYQKCNVSHCYVMDESKKILWEGQITGESTRVMTINY